jgi:Skp family chaperone for outer membrane proteins
MKKVAVVMLAAFSMAVAAPAFAAEMTKETKDMCLLASKGCANEAKSIQQKIKALDVEIKKGKKVYSADEIKKLEAKLKEANEILDNLMRP